MSLSENAQLLRDFVIQNFERMDSQNQGTYDYLLQFPSFDLLPFDYLDFAERELNKNSAESRVNCVNHLKRAVDCELDTLLHVLKLTKLKISVPRKLELIAKMGIFNSRSLEKLNQIRNKVEHEYAVPKVEDLEVYFELVQAFVYALDGFIYMLASSHTMTWQYTHQDDRRKHRHEFMAFYESEKPIVHYVLPDDEVDEGFVFEISDAKNIDDFAFAMKVFFLLSRARYLINLQFVVYELRKEMIESEYSDLTDSKRQRPENRLAEL
jgi:hypothetical protein